MIPALIFILPALFYTLVLLALLRGYHRLVPGRFDQEPQVSVIVAARNEEHNIARLLTALRLQSYPNVEVVIVDDGSTDRTAAIVRRFQESNSKIKLVQIGLENTPSSPRKKRALTAGIRQSHGEILVFTDADCVPLPGWVKGLVREFDASVGLVAGYSPYDPQPVALSGRHLFHEFLHAFVQYEEVKGALWSAGAIGLSRPWLCTGRNLAYRKVVWDEVGGFDKIMHSVSGDDDLFLQLVARQTSWRIRYCLSPETFVPTLPPGTFREFVRQRKRHFSAGKFFSGGMKVFFLTFHASNLVLMIGLFLGLLWPLMFSVAFWMFIVKTAVDFLFVLTGSRAFREQDLLLRFVIMEFLYVAYIALIGPLGFISDFEWKPEPQS